MYIRSVEVTSFGTIDGPLELHFDDGLTLIYGPNETGKSTLMRAIWLAFTRRASSQAQEIKDMEPHTGGTPSVKVVMEIEGDSFTLAKQFAGQKGEATLTIQRADGRVENFTGDEADEKLQHALGFGEMSGRARTPDHLGFWPITWVRQGEGGLDPAGQLTSDGNDQTLSETLAEMSGEVLAGTDAADVVERAREEYDRFYTSTGQETRKSGAPLHEARQTLDEVEAHFQELQARQLDFERDIQAYASAQQERDKLQEELPRQKEALTEAKEQQAAIDELEQKQKTLQQKEKAAQVSVEQLQDRIGARKKLREQKSNAAGEREEAESERSDAKEALEQLEEEKEALTKAKAASEEGLADRKAEVKTLQAHLDVLRTESELDELASQLEKIEEHENELREIKKSLADLSVDDETVESLEQLKEDLSRESARLDAAAAHLHIEAHADEQLSVDGDAVNLASDQAWNRRIDRETTIDIGSRLSLTVIPGGEDLPELRQHVEELTHELDEKLEQLGLPSLAKAKAQYRKRADLLADKKGLRGIIKTLVPDGRDEIESTKIELEADLAAARERRENGTEHKEVSFPESKNATEEALNEAKAALSELEASSEEARNAFQTHERKVGELRSEVRLAKQKFERAQKDLKAFEKELADHEKEYGSSEELQDKLQTRKDEWSGVQKKVAEVEERLEAMDPDAISAEVERLAGVIKTMEDELGEKKQEASRLEGRLGSKELHGLHDHMEKARQERDDAQREVERWERKAAVAKLLYETLEACKKDARAAYLAPLQKEVKRLMRRFSAFGDAHVAFGDEFEMQGLSRSADGTFSFEQLSGGAKEQLGLFIRIAMARIVARNRSHPLFLDEILAETDDDRFEAMATILREIASDLQLIVTTCHKDRYRQLGLPITDLGALKRASRAA